MDNQSGSTSTQPATVGKPAPGTGAGFSIPIPRDAAGRPIDSTLTEPTEVDEQTKQGSTQPGDGAAARVVVDAPSWKEKVIGYAKKTRGTMLRRRETKEHGQKILEGQATVSDINQVPVRSGQLQ